MYAIRSYYEIIEQIGGWDVKAIAEDTEISFRIYMMGYRIKFQPKSVTWEQEPQTLRVWFKQRTRWAKGNIYVIVKNLPLLFDRSARRIHFDLLYFLSIYFLLLTSLIMSDALLILYALGLVHTTIAGLSSFLWLLRITSYNVCYTKLLRNKYHAMTRGVLMQSEDPEATLKSFGINRQYAILVITSYSIHYTKLYESHLAFCAYTGTCLLLQYCLEIVQFELL